MSPRTLKLLYDVRSAGLAVTEFLNGRTFDDYQSDLFLRSAVERQFQIVGEALVRLRRDDPKAFELLSDVPSIVAFRNVFVHAYDDIDNSEVWRIISDHLPILLAEVESLMTESGDWPPAEEE
jgi:uncharacterized protein with HEPN domain